MSLNLNFTSFAHNDKNNPKTLKPIEATQTILYGKINSSLPFLKMEIMIEIPDTPNENNWVNNLPNPPRVKKYFIPNTSIICGTKAAIIPPLKRFETYIPITYKIGLSINILK